MQKRIKMYHEAPMSIFSRVQTFTDGDYALANVFETDEKYLQTFKEAVAQGRNVILDNGVYELDVAMNPDRFAYWINELKPTWYIIPDVLEDSEATCKNVRDWLNNQVKSIDPEIKKIGVVQGKDYKSLCDCYEFIAPKVDKVAISFNYSYYEQTVSHPNKLVQWGLGRAQVLQRMMRDDVLDPKKPLHLLGCSFVSEGILYKNTPVRDLIDSLDTSIPISTGMDCKHFKPWGNLEKSSIKMYTQMNAEINDEQGKYIFDNVWNFGKFWN